MKESKKVSKYSKGDTVIYPLLQMGLFGITQDENVTLKLLLDMPEASTTHLATGYFNLTPHYSNCILNSKGNYEILCAHPLANGFYKAGGIIGKFEQHCKTWPIWHKCNTNAKYNYD